MPADPINLLTPAAKYPQDSYTSSDTEAPTGPRVFVATAKTAVSFAFISLPRP